MPYPYPKELEEMFITADGQRVLLCAIRPEDEPAHCESLSKLTAEDNRFRFFGKVTQGKGGTSKPVTRQLG